MTEKDEHETYIAPDKPIGRCAALYARVSGDRQREEATIDSQIEELRIAIAERGDNLGTELLFADDGYTGEILARPALDQLRDQARRGAFAVLYVYDRGRLSRRYAHQEIIIEELTDLGIQFVTLHDVSAETPEDRVLQAMQGVFHEYERLRIAERFRRGRMFKARSGKLIGYVPKFGYSYVRKDASQDAQFIVNPTEAAVVLQIYKWYGEEGVTMRAIVRRLFELGLPPRRSPRGVWHISTIHNILRDETYVGRHHYNKTEAFVSHSVESKRKYRRSKRDHSRPRPKSEWIAIPVPAIIDEDLFDKVQSQRALNVQRSRRNAKQEYLFHGLIQCPCGAARHGRIYCRKYPVYRCGNEFACYPMPATCRRGYVRADIADAVLWHELAAVFTNPDFLREQATRWLNEGRLATQSGDPEDKSAEHDLTIAALRDEETRYARAYGSGNLTEDVFLKLTADVRKKRLKAETNRHPAPFQTGGDSQPHTVDEVVALATAGLATLDFKERERVVSSLVDRVILDRECAVVTGHFPLHAGQRTHLAHGSLGTIDANDALLSWHTPLGEPLKSLPFSLSVPLPELTRSKRYFQREADRFLAQLS